MSLVNGKRQISTPHSTDIYWPIVLKLKLKKHVRQATPHAKFRYDRIKGVGGANTQFVTVLVLSLFFFCLCILRTASWPYRWTNYDALWLIGRVFRQGSAFLGSRWWKLMFRGPNRRFKPNLQKLRLTISSNLQNWSTWNLNIGFQLPYRLRGWSSVSHRNFCCFSGVIYRIVLTMSFKLVSFYIYICCFTISHNIHVQTEL